MLRRYDLQALVLLLVLAASLPVSAADTTGKSTSRLDRALAAGDALDQDGKVHIWVHFTDKDQDPGHLAAALAHAEQKLTPGARARRQRAGGPVVDAADLPVAAAYLDRVTATGADLRQTSRWLNAASFSVAPAAVQKIAQLPFVAKVDLVGRLSSSQPRQDRAALEARRITAPAPVAEKSFSDLDYGFSGAQLEQINVPALHDNGLSGDGVVIAIFDTGFEFFHESLHHIDVVATYDFVDNDAVVSPQRDDPVDMGDHGSIMLSVMMGFSLGNIVGPAYGASAILARTEDMESETEAEEDNWIAALEWAEGLGADVVCSGIGYIDWYDFSDLDGTTAAITVAADLASARGLCVVNSAGNERENPAWGHIIPPADGTQVIAVGSVDPAGLVARFSSPGPTADGRIKPDVMARGGNVVVALPFVQGIYVYSEGSDLTAATIAGVVALMLEKNPTLSPFQVGQALRATADRYTQPDNDYGYGTVDAAAAASYWAPALVHEPLGPTQPNNISYPVDVSITSRLPLDPTALSLAWRQAGEGWNRIFLTQVGGDDFTASIPAQPWGTSVEYYISAGNDLGLTTTSPIPGPDDPYTFQVAPDTEAPVITHFRLTDQCAQIWPPTVTVVATDNVAVDRVEVNFEIDGGNATGWLELVPLGDDRYSLEVPIPVESLFPGQTVSYSLVAWDTGADPQVGFAGPYSFQYKFNLGRVILVDDRLETEASLAQIETWGLRPPAAAAKTTGPDLAQWLLDSGWDVEVIMAEDVTLNSFQGYDAVFMTSGRNTGPLAYQSLRDALLNWNASGGRILIESGELGYATVSVPSLAEIKTEILHMVDWASDDGRHLRIPPQFAEHPFHHRPYETPHALEVGSEGPAAFTFADVVFPDDEVRVLLNAPLGTTLGGALLYDNNSGPDRGQTVYLSIDLGELGETVGRPLVTNAMTYLTGTEEPGPSQISGRVTLVGASDFSGVMIRCGTDHTTFTAADGSYSFEGLWGGHYEISATKQGFAPSFHYRVLFDGQTQDDADFYLVPTVPVVAEETPDLPIPDNDPAGVSSLIYLPDSSRVADIAVNIDISHFSIGNLVVTLTSPAGTAVTLHNQGGATDDDIVGTWPDNLFVSGPGSLRDFLGEPATGPWILNVADVAFGATGRLNSWGLDLQVTLEGISAVDGALPPSTRLVGNVPNPFNPRTTVNFELAAPGSVRLGVYDVRGRLVARLAEGPFPAGSHAVSWEGTGQDGAPVASGVYFARLETPQGDQVHKMMLVQ